jgi:hypothetical protein
MVIGSSAGPNSWRSSLSTELSAVSPAWGNSVDASHWHWGVQASSDHGHPSPHVSSSPSYGLSSSPQSNLEQWLSLPLLGSARPHYERWVCVRPSVILNPPDAHAPGGGQHSNTSSLLQLGSGSLRGYYTSYDIADTSSSQWNHMFDHVLPSFNSMQVNMPHLTMPVHRQNEPLSETPYYCKPSFPVTFISRESFRFFHLCQLATVAVCGNCGV